MHHATAQMLKANERSTDPMGLTGKEIWIDIQGQFSSDNLSLSIFVTPNLASLNNLPTSCYGSTVLLLSPVLELKRLVIPDPIAGQASKGKK
jgi:hypothetical protein